MELIGSSTSPYVRRIRLLLCETPHRFSDLDIYNADREVLRQKTPIMRIPVLIDGDMTVYDSRIIARYIATEKLKVPPLNWNEENLVSIIDGATDALIALLLIKRSGIDVEADQLYIKLQKDRAATTLNELEKLVAKEAFEQWSYPAICLYTLLDWAEFRSMIDLGELPNLKAFKERNENRESVAATDPRKA